MNEGYLSQTRNFLAEFSVKDIPIKYIENIGEIKNVKHINEFFIVKCNLYEVLKG